mmetsp:Transcript_5612/g.12965  ORF Transcript_5612/g.12965 Transcript_5612/m.12965 type:complete len:249 (-) Transcript_5612:228-974(-)
MGVLLVSGLARRLYLEGYCTSLPGHTTGARDPAPVRLPLCGERAPVPVLQRQQDREPPDCPPVHLPNDTLCTCQRLLHLLPDLRAAHRRDLQRHIAHLPSAGARFFCLCHSQILHIWLKQPRRPWVLPFVSLSALSHLQHAEGIRLCGVVLLLADGRPGAPCAGRLYGGFRRQASGRRRARGAQKVGLETGEMQRSVLRVWKGGRGAGMRRLLDQRPRGLGVEPTQGTPPDWTLTAGTWLREGGLGSS